MEVTHVIAFGESRIAVDYDGLIRKANAHFEYVENERSWSGVFTVGRASLAKTDALLVTFAQASPDCYQ